MSRTPTVIMKIIRIIDKTQKPNKINVEKVFNMIFGFLLIRINDKLNKKNKGIPKLNTQKQNINIPSSPTPNIVRLKGISVKKAVSKNPNIEPINPNNEIIKRRIPTKYATAFKIKGIIFMKAFMMDLKKTEIELIILFSSYSTELLNSS